MFLLQMSSSEELRKGNTFSEESSFSDTSTSSTDIEDYLEPEPEVEITGTKQSSPHKAISLKTNGLSILGTPLNSQEVITT